MVKIDKTDIDNISLLRKELKLKDIQKIKIKKGNYEIEILSNHELFNYSNKTNKNESLISKEEKKENNPIKLENLVKSPMVGVAYLSPDPSSPSYIKEGQHVKQGDILLLIEAMKTFNEIKAPKSGVIKKILVLNSQPVEFGDDLIIFE